MRRLHHFSTRLVITLCLVTVVLALGSSWSIYTLARGKQMELLRQQLMATAATTAIGIDGERFQRLVAGGKDGDADWKVIADHLTVVQRANPAVRYIYTMARRDDLPRGQLAFIVDPGPEIDRNHNGRIDDDEERAVLGTTYDAVGTSPNMLDGLMKVTADEQLTVDAWGRFLSGYAPILDHGGRSVGMVGVDMDAERLDALERGFLLQCVVAMAAVAATAVAISIILALRFERPVSALLHGLGALAKGEDPGPLHIGGDAEFRHLGEALQRLALRLHLERQARRAGWLPDPVAQALAAGRDPAPPALADGCVLRLLLLPRPNCGPVSAVLAAGAVAARLRHGCRELGGHVVAADGQQILAWLPGSGPAVCLAVLRLAGSLTETAAGAVDLHGGLAAGPCFIGAVDETWVLGGTAATAAETLAVSARAGGLGLLIPSELARLLGQDLRSTPVDEGSAQVLYALT
jgi:hypothetical protein